MTTVHGGSINPVGSRLDLLPHQRGFNVRAGADLPSGAGRGVWPQRVALAWLLSLSDTTVPLPGPNRPETVTDSLAAADLELSHEELDAIGASAAT